MGKAKKKIVRPLYVSKEERAKQAPKKPVPRELKIGLIFCAAALVLAIILFLVFYRDGSLPMENNMPVTAGDNWLVANKGTSSEPKYFKIGEIAPIAGYTLDPDSVRDESLKMLRYTFSRDEGTENPITSYYVTGVNRKAVDNAETANTGYKSYLAESTTVTDVSHTTLAGHEVYYFTSVTAPNAEAETQTTQQMLVYMQGPRDTTYLIVLTADTSEESPVLTDEQWFATVEQIIGSITETEK